MCKFHIQWAEATYHSGVVLPDRMSCCKPEPQHGQQCRAGQHRDIGALLYWPGTSVFGNMLLHKGLLGLTMLTP